MTSKGGSVFILILGSITLGLSGGIYIGHYTIEQSAGNTVTIPASFVEIIVVLSLLGVGLLAWGIHGIMRAP